MTFVQEQSKREGFAGCWEFAPGFFSYYAKRQAEGTLHPLGRRLTADVRAEYPWADRIALMIYPYRPYPASACVSGYYVASNAAYHAAGRVLLALKEQGMRAERADVPVRELCIRTGIATALKNGLTCFGRFGSRVVCQALAICGGSSVPESIPGACPEDDGPTLDPRCADCTACARACPSRAILAGGFGFEKCLRGKMEAEIMPDALKAEMPSLFGCEQCQYACPVNREIDPEEEVPQALSPEAILQDGGKGALALIGKNQNKGGRVIAHACILAARRGRCDLLPLIVPFCTDGRELVADAAKWACGILSEGRHDGKAR